ncbi:MAG: glycoside hydrolase family 95 protein [Clostridia bacterium]|nr:glycoside hydrolase family 95 protein [Clostridia bacterium]
MENTLWYKSEARVFAEALPLGNGSLGAMVYGKTDIEKISFNHDTFWSGKPSKYAPENNAYEAYMEAQKLMLQGDRRGAEITLEQNFTGPSSQSYLPLGNLYIKCKTSAKPTEYYRELDMEEGVVKVQYKEDGICFRREYFISYPDKCFVVRIISDKPCDYVITMDSQVKHSIVAADDRLIMQGEAPTKLSPFYQNDKIVEYDGDGVKFASVVSVTCDGNFSVNNEKIFIENSMEACIFLCAETSFINFRTMPTKDCLSPCMQNINSAIKKGYTDIYNSHIRDFSKYYNRVKVDFGFTSSKKCTDERLRAEDKSEDLGLVELLFNFGRYLVIASSREGSQATNLQGIWNEELHAPWSSNYTVNINTEMNYWPVLMCNLAEMNLPIVELVKKISVTGADVARIFYNAKGFCAHHNIDLWGHATAVGKGEDGCMCYAYWNVSAGWLCRHLWEHYEYTLDKKFLMETAYPLMKGAAEFFLSILVEDNGRYIITPSTSPENFYYYKNSKLALAKYITMSQAIVMDLFENICKAADILSIDDEFTAEIQEKLSKLNTYSIGSEGQLLEFDEEFPEYDVHHRHHSHLYGLYPGESITVNSTPELAEACRVTLNRRGDESNGWSIAWRVILWAKLKDGNRALKLIKNHLRFVEGSNGKISYDSDGGTYPNMFDAHPPFQIDGNFGVCAGIAQMFLQCEDGKICILPALPDEFINGSVSGLKAKGNVSVDIEWYNGKLTSCILESPVEQTVNISMPNGEVTVFLPANQKVQVML